MIEILLEHLVGNIKEGTIRQWFVDEDEPVHQGDDLVEIQTPAGNVTVTSKVSGLLAEVYYDEGETVTQGEVLCTIDDEEPIEEATDEDEK